MENKTTLTLKKGQRTTQKHERNIHARKPAPRQTAEPEGHWSTDSSIGATDGARVLGIRGNTRAEITGLKQRKDKTVINYRTDNACGAPPPMEDTSTF